MMRTDKEIYDASQRVATRAAKLLDALEKVTGQDASETAILDLVAGAYVAGVLDGRDETMENRSEWL